MQLTDRQRQIYDFIVDFRRANGCSPSIPEIQRKFGIRSPNGVAGHLRALEAKGMIRRAERGSRQIDLPSEDGAAAKETYPLPVFGDIPAGVPVDPQSAAPDACLLLDEAALGFKPDSRVFALKVRGDSMRDAGIFNGDVVVVQPGSEPKAGQVVAALVDGECTLKRLVRMKGQWYLKAENPDYPEIHPRASLAVQGVVRTVIRRMG